MAYDKRNIESQGKWHFSGKRSSPDVLPYPAQNAYWSDIGFHISYYIRRLHKQILGCDERKLRDGRKSIRNFTWVEEFGKGQWNFQAKLPGNSLDRIIIWGQWSLTKYRTLVAWEKIPIWLTWWTQNLSPIDNFVAVLVFQSRWTRTRTLRYSDDKVAQLAHSHTYYLVVNCDIPSANW